MYKIAVTRPMAPAAMEYASRFGEVTVLDTIDPDEVLAKLRENPVDALIARWTRLDEKFIAGFKATGGKVLAKHGTGVDSCDLNAATKAGIPIVYAFGANARAVAEYTVAMILAAYKKLTYCDRHSHSGDNSYGKTTYTCKEILGKKLYIIGFGNIGRQVAEMCKGLGMQVCAYDKYLTKEMIEEKGVACCVNLYDGLKDADIVSIHMPLTDETKGIVNRDFLQHMKDGSYFINAARADLMDENAVIDCLEEGKLAGAAFDACSIDKNIVNPRLCHCENLILSAHIAAMAEEALAHVGEMCVDGVMAALNQKRWKVTANPAVYDVLKW